MTPELKKYAQQDEGYNQFCTRYDHVSADPKTREQIIDELELDEAQIKILDNFESYTHLLM